MVNREEGLYKALKHLFNGVASGSTSFRHELYIALIVPVTNVTVLVLHLYCCFEGPLLQLLTPSDLKCLLAKVTVETILVGLFSPYRYLYRSR